MQMQEAIANKSVSEDLKLAFEQWISTMNEGVASENASKILISMLKKENSAFAKEMLEMEQYFTKKSVWVIGGDGWAYDIGFGGLDHVIASGEDINLLVLDTEVYSNTGGQASKATPVGAVAKFAAAGKRIRKKDLGIMAMSYGYVYVAQVSLGASHSQFFNAMKEAEAYKGPSVIIAYSPCINHGLNEGMGRTQYQSKYAVEAGYWQLFRYNPMLEAEGKNPFTLDSKEPDWDQFQKFLNSEVRYTSLKKSFPKEAAELFMAAEENAKWRYKQYKRLAEAPF
jgi:pyruvate-ferredoxin/flavodoxin oxidoreductase